MRKLVIALLLSVLMLNLSTAVFAAEKIEDKVASKSLANFKEKDKVQEATSKSEPIKYIFDKKDVLGIKVDNVNDIKTGEPFKVTIATKDFVDDLLAGRDLSSSLEVAPVRWDIPVSTKSDNHLTTYSIEKTQDTWDVVEFGDYLSDDQISLSSKPKKLSKLFEDKSILTADNFAHIRMPSLHSDFLYVSNNGTEYFVPLTYGKNSIGSLKNQSIYTREELVSEIEPLVTSNLTTGGMPAKIDSDNKNQVLIYSILVIGFLVFGVVLMRHRKLRQTKI